jgi:HSP20 family protein
MNAMTKTEKRPQERNQTQPYQEQQGGRGYISPRVNILETRDSYLLEAEMPGVNKEGLEVLLEGSELTLVGRRQIESGDLELIYRESRPRDFRRVFELDPSIDTSKIEARMEQGVLKLHFPKAEKVKPRKITVSE